MSNHYFQFKQFTVHQDKCAMKVSTDACIQGAWTVVADNVKHVLDIGAGTGLLSLMLAQKKSSINIDAIELDADAAQQAKENIDASQWSNRISVIQADVRSYPFSSTYDLIICNPPFFNNSLLGDNADRNNVRHTLSLSYTDLFNALQQLLSADGYASILLPAAEHEIWASIVKGNGWYFEKELHIVPRKGMSHNRVVSVCTPGRVNLQQETLYIYNGDNSYTQQFIDLMQPYYLKL